MSQFDLKCPRKDHDQITKVHIGREKVGELKYRLICQECEVDDRKDWDLSKEKKDETCMNFTMLLAYQRTDLGGKNEENRCEVRIPIEIGIKKKALKAILGFEEIKEDQLNQIESIFNRLLEGVKASIQLKKAQAISFNNYIESEGKALEDKFNEIVDLTQIIEIIQKEKNPQQLDFILKSFIIQRLDQKVSDPHNPNKTNLLRKLQQTFTRIHNEYHTQIFDENAKFSNECVQSISLDRYKSKPVTKDMKKIFNSIADDSSSSSFMRETHSEESETLILGSGETGKAIKIDNLDEKSKIQIQLEISLNEKNSSVSIGLAENENLVAPLPQTLLNFNRKGEQSNAYIAQYGNNFSNENNERTTQVVWLNVCLAKNYISFQNENKTSKLIPSQPLQLHNGKRKYLVIFGVGAVQVTQIQFIKN